MAEGVVGEKPKLFDEVTFSVIRSKSLDDQYALQLSKLLVDNGAVECSSFSVDQVTHIISNTSDFPAYNAACDALIPVVKAGWVEACLSKGRLAQMRPWSPDPNLFFAGVQITCTNLPKGDEEAIIAGVIAMGGQYSRQLTKLVTHIVALSTDNEKCEQAIAKRPDMKIVLPHWFDDCLKLGKKIDERPYMLPDAEITRKAPEEPVSIPKSPSVVGASSPKPGPLPTPTNSPSPGRLQVFQGKNVMLAQDLDLGGRLRGTIQDLITAGGGTVTSTVRKADMLVCQYRDGDDYIVASRSRKDVGNLSWLYYLITHNSWTSPFRRLLHYPIARDGLPGFKDTMISVSNYGGEARLYLENLVMAAGGRFTKTMRQENTHLITARQFSEKCTAAKEWNINMVNHLWLEESYSKWEMQALTNPRYTHFPSRTNLGEVVGQTPIERSVLEKHFFPLNKDKKAEEEDRHKSAMQRSHHDASSSSSVETNSLTQHTSLALRRSDPSDPVQRLKEDRKSVSTPSKRIGNAEKENHTPSSIGSRSAKARAAAAIHELAPDMALYEKEMRKKGGMVRPSRVIKSDLVDPNRKRSISVASEEKTSPLGSVDGRDDLTERKRAKIVGKVPVQIRLLVTSYSRWTGQLTTAREDQDKKVLRELGIIVTMDPSNCTHLAAPGIVRTPKFVCALAAGATVLSCKFIDDCLAESEMPEDIGSYALKDSDGERRLGIKLRQVVARGKANKGKLFKDLRIWSTPSLENQSTYRSIIEANGAKLRIFKAKGGSASKTRESEDTDMTRDELASGIDDGAIAYLLSGETEEEKSLWKSFAAKAEDKGRKAKIVSTDWVLDSAMSQEMKWKNEYLVKLR